MTDTIYVLFQTDLAADTVTPMLANIDGQQHPLPLAGLDVNGNGLTYNGFRYSVARELGSRQIDGGRYESGRAYTLAAGWLVLISSHAYSKPDGGQLEPAPGGRLLATREEAEAKAEGWIAAYDGAGRRHSCQAAIAYTDGSGDPALVARIDTRAGTWEAIQEEAGTATNSPAPEAPTSEDPDTDHDTTDDLDAQAAAIVGSLEALALAGPWVRAAVEVRTPERAFTVINRRLAGLVTDKAEAAGWRWRGSLRHWQAPAAA